MVLEWLKKPTKNLKQIEEEIMNEEQKPVDVKEIEDLIRIINTVKDINCIFSLVLRLEIGEFSVQNDNLKEIKLLKATKTQQERLSITHTNTLLTMETTIELRHITGITFKLAFNDSNIIED